MHTVNSAGSGGSRTIHVDEAPHIKASHAEIQPDPESAGPIEATQADLPQIWHWNQTVPPLMQTCMHDLISQQADQHPDTIAVQSWDGSLTYGQLEKLSNNLAHYLQSKGFNVGSKIPLCFEKSMWAVVALLGVMKSGATFSMTDPSQPEARLRTIVEQTSAELVVTSEAQKELGLRISSNGQVLAVSQAFFDTLPDQPQQPLAQVPSSAAMYIIFTSGSTGKPKGVVISHENYTSGAVPRAEAVGYTSNSRVFDFPSYAFDVSIDCMVCTLAVGGRVCVPSEEARMNDLSGAIRDSKANMVHMTPSVARVLDSDIIPSLEVLGLGGEAVGASDAATWSQSTSLIIAYGPSECTVGCTINNTVTVSTGIGKGVGGVTWIVDPDDHNRLMPVGAVGELIIEGPVVGIGYLDEPGKTAEVFIEDPTWLGTGHGSMSGRHGRLYKTGDLVRYESNGSGSIEFVGRKDQQVKLRGQRVELAEVEHHLRLSLPVGVKVAAEVLKPKDGSPTLVAFLSESGSSASITEDIITEPSAELSAAIASIDTTMGSRVPRYMVPAAFITLKDMPSLVSRKIDRKKLREIGLSIPREKLGNLQSGEGQDQEPETESEKLLHVAWLNVLGQEAKVYRQSSFFVLGGDSLRAMRLVAAAREQGLAVTVADIFTAPVLSDMALKAQRISTNSREEIAPFSLLESGWTEEEARRETASLCGIDTAVVEDIYPCTPLQEALMALSAKVKEAYVAQRVVELKDVATAERLIQAFVVAEKDCPILRTRVVQVPGRGLVQVVVDKKLECPSHSNLDDYLRSDRDDAMELGKPLVRHAVVNDTATGKVSFVLTMHHALYDGWAMPLVVERVNKAYLSNETLSRPAEYKHFIKYLGEMDRTESETYWREQLSGANRRQFPSLPWKGYQTKADSLWEVYVPLEHPPASNVTVATVIRAAWGIVASQYINSGDVIFGETLTGRNAPIIGAEEIEGPMITTVPFRVQVDPRAPVAEYLQDIQEQTVNQMQYEHFGLQHIRRLSPDALEACELRTGLVLHPSTEAQTTADADDLPANRLVPAGDAEAAQEALKFNTYALMLVCSIDPKGFLIMASFDSNTIDMATMKRVLEQLKQSAQLLCNSTTGKVEDVQQISEEEIGHVRDVTGRSVAEEVLKDYPGAEAAYIVNSQDNNRLVPVGGVGELLIQASSPLELSSINAPTWLPKLREETPSGSESLFYKTGKQAKYDLEGHIVLIATDVADSMQTNNNGPTKRISATSRKQRKLRSLWSRVLKIAEENIGLNDSFFLLGGDSITAMKLVSEGRLEGVALTVVQIFQKRSLYDMANAMEGTVAETTQREEVAPFSLLDVEDKTAFLENVVRPQLVDPEWKIENVLPARPLQEVAVQGTVNIPRFSARYELMYFDKPLERERLKQSCRELVSRNEILRTVFVQEAERCYSVVLESLESAFVEYEIDSEVESFAKQLCQLDVLTRMPLGSCFVKWFLVEGSDGRSCVIFRISHAQYDEICLPLLLRQFSCLYEGKPVQATVPFSSYAAHVLLENIPKSIQYWQDLLAGSSMTLFRPDIPVENRHHFAIQKTVDISSRSRDMTVATLPTAAWALCLAQHLSLRDVTFGEVVSGRNVDFPNADAVIGPCWQYVPVRIKFGNDWTVADLLEHVQHQHVASAAHEGMGLKEIVDECTDWPSTVDWFDTVVHQDVEHVESLDFLAASSRMETVYVHEEPLREWKIQAFIQGEQLTLEIVTVESWGEYATGLLEELANATRFLVRDPRARLFGPEASA